MVYMEQFNPSAPANTNETVPSREQQLTQVRQVIDQALSDFDAKKAQALATLKTNPAVFNAAARFAGSVEELVNDIPVVNVWGTSSDQSLNQVKDILSDESNFSDMAIHPEAAEEIRSTLNSRLDMITEMFGQEITEDEALAMFREKIGVNSEFRQPLNTSPLLK